MIYPKLFIVLLLFLSEKNVAKSFNKFKYTPLDFSINLLIDKLYILTESLLLISACLFYEIFVYNLLYCEFIFNFS